MTLSHSECNSDRCSEERLFDGFLFLKFRVV